MKKITLLSILLVIALFSMSSCTSTVPPQEYDRVKNELSAAQSQLTSLQDKLAETELLQAQNEELKKQYSAVKGELETTQAKYEELSTEFEDLNKQFDSLKSEFETTQAKYEELSTEYEDLNKQFEELSKQPDIIIEETAEISEEAIEQAVFQLINQERENNDLDELIWGTNLYKWATANSRNMATSKRYEYSDYASWQEVYWAAGHSTTDEIVNGAFIVWKNSQQYERNIINKVATYGAVGVYKSGEIFYITYIASTFP
ncbi:CAP domain-containing protein [Chloroflexota bacterium]